MNFPIHILSVIHYINVGMRMERKPGENALKKLHTRSSITFKPQNVFRSTLFIFFSNIPCLLSVLNFKAFVVECECGTQRREDW